MPLVWWGLYRTRFGLRLRAVGELLAYLTDNDIPWAIATSGRIETAGPVLKILGVEAEKHVIITRDLVRFAKPDPDLFLAAAEKLDCDINTACVVGDAIWDMLAARRARARWRPSRRGRRRCRRSRGRLRSSKSGG